MAISTRDVAVEGPPNRDGRGLLHDGSAACRPTGRVLGSLSRRTDLLALEVAATLSGVNDVDAPGQTWQETERDD